MNKNILFASVFLAMGALLGFAVGRLGGADARLAQELETLRGQVEEAKKLLPAVLEEMSSVGGTVLTVSAGTLTIDTPLANPFADLPRKRTVMVNQRTKITVLRAKDQERYQNEVRAFQEAIRSGVAASAGSLLGPSSFEETPGTLANIKVGQFVSAAADQNIRNDEHFTASEIRIHLSSDRQ